MEMKSPFSRRSVEGEILIITDKPVSIDNAVNNIICLEHGAIVTFSGSVRGTEKGAPISSIMYDAYKEMAEKEIGKIVTYVRNYWNVSVSLQHRIGRVPVGEASIVIACSGAHRKEAFEACQYVIDKIKESVPVWKVKYEKQEL